MSDMKTIEALMQTAESELGALLEKRRPLDAAISQIRSDLDSLSEERGSLMVENFKREGPDWAFMLADTGNVSGGSMAILRYFSTLLRDCFGMYLSGFFEETHQGCPHIKIDRASDESERKTLEGVKTLLPFLKPFEDGFAHIPVWKQGEMFDYHLLVKPDLSHISIDHPGCWDHLTFPTLEAAISHIREHLWYEDSGRKDRDTYEENED